MFDFIDNFQFEEASFENYKKGVVVRKKQGHNSIFQESSEASVRLTRFCLETDHQIDWNRTKKEIDFIENNVTLQKCKKFFKALCTPAAERGFLATRVFSNKNKDNMQHESLEKKALLGK